MDYKTPNVYVEEISTLPPSVAGVSTAIPAFVGHTQKAEKNGVDLTGKPTRVENLLEYTNFFGGPPDSDITVTKNNAALEVVIQPVEHTLFYNLRLYFSNGGGPCYIVSIGSYEDVLFKDGFLGRSATENDPGEPNVFDELEKEDEPTLILLSAAINLGEDGGYYEVCQQALSHCKNMKDRFAILDVLQTDADDKPYETFRDEIGSNDLKYGAAYYPYLQTTLNYHYTDNSVTLEGFDDVKDAKDTTISMSKLSVAKEYDTALYNQIKAELNKQRLILPSSAAVAGVYVKTDKERGVWKAPANVSLASVIGPVLKITDANQESLNVHPLTGKSINAVRSFAGKGTMVWGARTLAGNDNEWRYIPVRRLFIYIEESIQKATAFAVFEPNTAMTWLKIRTMIESFLEELWRQGALAGASPDQAFFVNVGLGTSMIEQDILEGRMIVEIGVAAVRPAEFIILRFSHKLQEA